MGHSRALPPLPQEEALAGGLPACLPAYQVVLAPAAAACSARCRHFALTCLPACLPATGIGALTRMRSLLLCRNQLAALPLSVGDMAALLQLVRRRSGPTGGDASHGGLLHAALFKAV